MMPHWCTKIYIVHADPNHILWYGPIPNLIYSATNDMSIDEY